MSLKGKLCLQILACGAAGLAVLAIIAIVSGPDSNGSAFAYKLLFVVVAGVLLNLIRVAFTPESAFSKRTPVDPIKRRKQWILVAIYFGIMAVWVAGLIPIAELITGLTSNERLVALVLYVIAMGIISMIVTFGISARLGVSRFKPAPWVRRLFKIPDNYQPPGSS